jgi:uncharacterized protein
MTDTPTFRTNGHGGEGHGPVATGRLGARPVRDTPRDGTHVERRLGAGDDDLFIGTRDAANETDSPVRVPGVAEGKVRPVPGRVHVTWRHALAAGVTCFAVWLLLDAPTLLRSAQESPLGTRRSVAMAVLRPVADVSDALGLSHVVGGANRAIGHTGNTGSGVLQVEGPPAHAHRALPPHPPVVAPPVTGASSTTPVTGASPTTAVTAPDGLAPLGTPTPSAPLRLLVVGDSLGIDFGQPLVNDLAATDVVSAVLDGHIDTGLSRPDYFDWQTELQTDLGRYQPQAVVVFIGANDPQSFVDGGTALSYGTAAWDAAYAKRVGTFMQAARDSGARVLWVGMPPMADPVLNAKMETLNGIAQSQAALHPGVTYFASWPVLSDPQGRFAAFLPNASGNEVQIRDPDGTHIAGPGAQRLSQAALAFMGHEWGLVL